MGADQLELLHSDSPYQINNKLRAGKFPAMHVSSLGTLVRYVEEASSDWLKVMPTVADQALEGEDTVLRRVVL